MVGFASGGNTSGRPSMELLPLKNLVALPAPPLGAAETEWEAELGVGKNPRYEDVHLISMDLMI